MNDLTTTNIQNNLGLSPETFKHLKTYDDYVNFYVQLEEVSSGFSWMKSDLLLDAENKMGDKSLRKFSTEVNQPYSTISNYIRVAKAFTPDERDVGASFSLHFQASFADSYSEDVQGFVGNKRFEWLAKAMDDNMSTRKLASEIQREKQRGLIEDGDETAQRKQDTKEVLHDIQKSLSVLVRKSNEGSTDALNQLKGVRNHIYGREEKGSRRS